MSDTFDHLCDAYENYLYDGDAGLYYSDHDDLFYHHRISVLIVASTDKAYLLENSKGQYWIPKKLIKEVNGSLYQWDQFNLKYLENNIDLIEGEDIKF